MVLVFLLLLAVWSLVAVLSDPGEGGGPVFLPSPWTVISDLIEMLVEEQFIVDIGQSIKRIVLGMLVSAVPAFCLGIWFGTSPRVHAAATPLFAFAKYIPPVALVPILILWLGIGLKQQIALLFLGTFFYLTAMVAETVANTPEEYKQAGLTLGAQPRQLIWKVVIPFGLPEFIQHLRVMVGIAWTYLTVAEMVAAEDGIGRVIINSQRYLQTGRVLAGVLTIGLLGICCDLLLKGSSHLLCKWKH